MEPKFGYKNNISSNLKEKIKTRCELLGLVLNTRTTNTTPLKTRGKKELFDSRSN